MVTLKPKEYSFFDLFWSCFGSDKFVDTCISVVIIKSIGPGLGPKWLRIKHRSYWQDFTVFVQILKILDATKLAVKFFYTIYFKIWSSNRNLTIFFFQTLYTYLKRGLDPKSLRINPRSYWLEFTVFVQILKIIDAGKYWHKFCGRIKYGTRITWKNPLKYCEIFKSTIFLRNTYLKYEIYFTEREPKIRNSLINGQKG